MTPSDSRKVFDAGLPKAVLDIASKDRSNLFAWRGQFSPQLVEALLSAYARPNCLVLDPFMGSGTALVEAASLGHEAHGCEVNPAALAIARLYRFCEMARESRQVHLAEAQELIVRQTMESLPLFAEHSAEGILSPPEFVRACQRHGNQHVRFLLEAALVLSDVGDDSSSSLQATWRRVRAVVEELPVSARPIEVHLTDARVVPLRDHTVGFVVTSPPYVNVFNYHHHYRRAVEALGWNPLAVARSEIGSNRKFRQNRYLTVVRTALISLWFSKNSVACVRTMREWSS